MTENKELIQQTPVEDTPFTMVKYEDKYFLTMGKYRLTEPMENESEVRKHLSTHKWEITLQLIDIMITMKEESKREQEVELINEKQ